MPGGCAILVGEVGMGLGGGRRAAWHRGAGSSCGISKRQVTQQSREQSGQLPGGGGAPESSCAGWSAAQGSARAWFQGLGGGGKQACGLKTLPWAPPWPLAPSTAEPRHLIHRQPRLCGAHGPVLTRGGRPALPRRVSLCVEAAGGVTVPEVWPGSPPAASQVPLPASPRLLGPPGSRASS